ncbi:hypothetical protein ACRYI5_08405 [Furfurilactobacillus sp. WILCCON 0119]
MADWTTQLVVKNTTKQDRLLSDRYVYPKNRVDSFPEIIRAGKTATFKVVSPSGKPYGPEFWIKLVADSPVGHESLGSIYFHVDIPYGRHINELVVRANNELAFKLNPSELKNGAHDYFGELTIGLLNDAKEPTNEKWTEELIIE